MRQTALFTIISLLLTLPSLAQTTDQAGADAAAWLAGVYHNQAQAKADSDFYEIHLHMKPIWKSKKLGHWLYVEQAMAKALTKPYRQRLYHVFGRPDGKVISAVFNLKSPARYAGQWANEALLDQLTVDSLLERAGCEVILVKTADGYRGGTGEKTCPSDLRGASWAVSEVTMTKNLLLSWDRGYDAAGKQVWGAVKGGYKFDKVETLK